MFTKEDKKVIFKTYTLCLILLVEIAPTIR